MSDETTILRVAETEYQQARKTFYDHIRACPDGCPDDRSLAAHLDRTRRQVALLAPAETESEALF